MNKKIIKYSIKQFPVRSLVTLKDTSIYPFYKYPKNTIWQVMGYNKLREDFVTACLYPPYESKITGPMYETLIDNLERAKPPEGGY